ncbi:tRNA pseudouridine(55) synthase TruB [Thioalkalivibrio sp. ALE19]|uniref:tRNA pseudouridine(55) synthase TruB n=1 Tax=Thioalkalivibrio sp. ALE19 TaxID=1266909 RepID=UPI000423FE99|nr:tRNA pseudouridine(55) synthase TruB [Thioalkalivibrio sp. ALE19]
MARRKGRNVDGILLLDKPQGLSSNQALGRVKYLLGARKAGHTGALDPRATGLLPLCFGQATKVSGWLLDADKRYVAVARLGVETDSADMDGEILAESPVPAITDEDLARLDRGFTGDLEQVPPMVSALKKDGRRLYELAREGVEVDRPPRPVRIHSLNIERRADDRLRLEVHCSKGTYIRSLVTDIGEALGCGAAVEELRRTGHGAFAADAMWTLEALEQRFEEGGAAAIEAGLLPSEAALSGWPQLHLGAAGAAALRHGNPAGAEAVSERIAGVSPAADEPEAGGVLVRLHGPAGEFLGVGLEAGDGTIRPRRLFVTG